MLVIDMMSKEDRKLLIGLNARTYLHGECYAFAIALHRGLGWQIVGLMNAAEEAEHAGVRSPDGRIFDARGYRTEMEFADRYLPPPFVFRDLEESDLYAIRPVLDSAIDGARSFAESVWPLLPWTGSAVARVMAFADEFEQLCQKHDIWPHGRVPASAPLTSFGDGSEDGYRFWPALDGRSFMFERRFKQE